MIDLDDWIRELDEQPDREIIDHVSDAQTVTITAAGSSKAGVILAVEDDGVTVEML